MNSEKIPRTDSIQELAEFWDTHDLTEFESELEEVKEPVLVREATISVRLHADDARAVHDVAQSRGVADSELIRQWILERIHAT